MVARSVPVRSRRRVGRRLVCAVITASAVVVASSVSAVPARAVTSFVVLQMNLCNSGMAVGSCYSFGRAVDEAVAQIHRHPPDLVTLQEVCRDDLYAGNGWGPLARAMADLYGSGHIAVDFVAAWNRDTTDWYRCVNGQRFGVAVMHHDNGRDFDNGWYSSQDTSDEMRAWTCMTVVKGRLTGCTTHLSTDSDVAMRQCRELMSVLSTRATTAEVIISGDFNLVSAPGKPFDVQRCVSSGFDRRGDSAVQQVFFTRNIQWVRGAHEAMRWTDHPLLYERFRV
jgi:hypothetical protein